MSACHMLILDELNSSPAAGPTSLNVNLPSLQQCTPSLQCNFKNKKLLNPRWHGDSRTYSPPNNAQAKTVAPKPRPPLRQHRDRYREGSLGIAIIRTAVLAGARAELLDRCEYVVVRGARADDGDEAVDRVLIASLQELKQLGGIGAVV